MHKFPVGRRNFRFNRFEHGLQNTEAENRKPEGKSAFYGRGFGFICENWPTKARK
jgi:hypothetical protein